MQDRDHEYVILGGGVAGLSAGIRLLELGFSPLLIEGGSYPAHKVCGEFLSPPCLPLLRRWGIDSLSIKQLEWSSGSQTVSFALPKEAGALSHLTLDLDLAKRMTRMGGKLLTHTKVVELIPMKRVGNSHTLLLSSGDKVHAKHLLVATGRLPGSNPVVQFPYIGLKAHFSGLDLAPALQMFSVPGAYLGIVPVENGCANIACLATLEEFQKYPSSALFMQKMISSHPKLCEFLNVGTNLFDGWMEARIPNFGWRSPPCWPQTYWIGDAIGTIPPASGNGLSFALASGFFAADYAAKQQPDVFRKMWRRRLAIPFFLAKSLHRIFLDPLWSTRTIKFSQHFPVIAQKVFSLTRFH